MTSQPVPGQLFRVLSTQSEDDTCAGATHRSRRIETSARRPQMVQFFCKTCAKYSQALPWEHATHMLSTVTKTDYRCSLFQGSEHCIHSSLPQRFLYSHRVTPHFEGHKKTKRMVGLTYFYDARIHNSDPKSVQILTQNNGCQSYIFYQK